MTNVNRSKDISDEKAWTIVGLKDCPWTAKAEELLKSKEATYTMIYLDITWHRKLVLEYNTRRVPAVFRGSQYIGSYAALEAYFQCSFIGDWEVFN